MQRERIQVVLDPDLKEWLTAEAESDMRSVSSYVRRLIMKDREELEKLEAAELADRIPIP